MQITFSIALMSLVFCSITSRAFADEPLQPKHLYEAPQELIGHERQEFLRKMDASKYEENLKSWQETCNPKNTLPEDVLQSAWKWNCAIELEKNITDLQVVNQVGVSVESTLYAKFQKTFDEFGYDARKKYAKKSVLEICKDLPDFVGELRRVITKQSVRDSAPDTLTFLARFTLVPPIGEPEKSKVSSECWMELEIFSSNRELPVYPRVLVHKLLAERTKMILLKPHPTLDRLAEGVRIFWATPLAANRPSPKDALKPLPPLKPDGLTCEEREAKLNFSLIENVKSNTHQMEAVYGPSRDSPFEFTGDLVDRFRRRLTFGKVLTYEEIHQICGELVKDFRHEIEECKSHFQFVIEPYPHGKFTYSCLRIANEN